MIAGTVRASALTGRAPGKTYSDWTAAAWLGGEKELRQKSEAAALQLQRAESKLRNALVAELADRQRRIELQERGLVQILQPEKKKEDHE